MAEDLVRREILMGLDAAALRDLLGPPSLDGGSLCWIVARRGQIRDSVSKGHPKLVVWFEFEGGRISNCSTNVKVDELPPGEFDLDAWAANRDASRLKLVRPLLDGLFTGLSREDAIALLGPPDVSRGDHPTWLVGRGMFDDWLLVVCMDEDGCVGSACVMPD